MFRIVRIGILLFLLVMVFVGAWQAKKRTTSWQQTVHAVVFPINADASAETQRYIAGLQESDFDPVEQFIEHEAAHYGIKLYRPIDLEIAPQVHSLPPPVIDSRSFLDVTLWSLKLRWWAWRNADWHGRRPDLRLFVLYHDPATHQRLDFSVGIQPGQIALVKAYAGKKFNGDNNVILTHEMLHTLGATDKYDYSSLQPFFPEGYANPEWRPLYPQEQAELMGGRIPSSQNRSEIPRSLDQTMIGELTAREIGLIR